MKTNSAWHYRLRDWPWLIGAAALYALLAKTALALYSANGLVTIFWPGAGVSLAALLLGGRKFWLAIYAGAWAGAVWHGQTLAIASLLALGSTLEPLLGSWLLKRRAGFDISLGSVRDIFSLFALAGLFSPVVCSLIGVGTLRYFGNVTAEAYWQSLAIWWMGDTLGIVLITPLILLWRHPPRISRAQLAEGCLVAGVTFLFGQITYLDWFPSLFSHLNRGYWMYLFVTWAAIRMGAHGVMLLLLITTIQALVGSTLGAGFFGDDLARAHLGNLWAYTMILCMVGLSLATIFAERRAVELSLHQNERELREAQNLAGLGGWWWNTQTGIQRWSEEIYRIYGRDPALPAASYPEIKKYFTPDSWARLSATLETALGQGLAYECDAEVVRPDGSHRWIVARGEAIRNEVGKIVELRGTIQDITERKRTEATLQAWNAEMEQIMRHQVAKQTIAAITHELNQPLVAISSYAEAALRLLRAGNQQPDKLLYALERSAEQAQRAGQVARQLMNYLDHEEIDLDRVDLNALARKVMRSIEQDHHGEFVTRLELEPGLAPVGAQRLQIEKILANLVENGIEAMREKDSRSREIVVTVRTHADGDMAQVSVGDNGPGVDEKLRKRIFDPFFTTKKRGLGMGLPISRAIIETHGGQLWLESGSGAGAKFHFTLPFVP